MKVITKQELIDKVNEVKGSTFISIDTATTPNMRKTGNPYMETTKITTLSGILNFDYATSVNNELQREGKDADFVPQKRAWGEKENNWITHKNQYYLPIKVQGSSDPVFKFNGVDLDRAELAPFLYESVKPHTQENVDNEVVVRDLKIDSIKCIRMMGEEFVIA